MRYFVYVLYSAKLNKYYVGRTTNLEQRLEFHNNPIEGRKFTARGIPWRLKFSHACSGLEESILLEKKPKKMKSDALIANCESIQFSETHLPDRLFRLQPQFAKVTYREN